MDEEKCLITDKLEIFREIKDGCKKDQICMYLNVFNVTYLHTKYKYL